MILAYLILAHLLADFIFQPSKLVMWKIKSKVGVLVHASIHFFVNLLILLPLLINGYYWLIGVIFGMCFTHFWIDEAKINYDLKHDTKVVPFIVDQLLHLTVIFLISYLLWDIVFEVPKTAFYLIYGDIRIITFVSFLVFSSTVIEVYGLQKTQERNKKAKLRINTDKMLRRTLVFSIIYIFITLLTFFISDPGKIL